MNPQGPYSLELLKRLQATQPGAAPAKADDMEAVDQDVVDDNTQTPYTPAELLGVKPKPDFSSLQRVSMSGLGAVSGTPEEKQMRMDVERNITDEMKRRQEDLGRDRMAVEAEAGKSGFQKMDLSPVMQLAAIAGANPKEVSMYTAPVDKQKELRAQLEKSQEGLATAQNSFLKNQLEKQAYGAVMTAAQRERLDNQNQKIHQQIVNSVVNDPIARKRVAQFQNLDNEMQLMLKADTTPIQMVDDFQQILIQNMGINGSSTGHERADRLIRSKGWDAKRFWQTVTGNPQDIAKDDKLVSLMREVATLEQENIKKNIDSVIAMKSPASRTFYKKHPELKYDFDASMQGLVASVTPSEAGAAFAIKPNQTATNQVAGINAPGTTVSSAKPKILSREEFFKTLEPTK